MNPDQMDNGTSRINTEEAAMIVGFIEHLVLNKTSPEKITVLTFYGGQKHEIIKRVRRNNNLKACELRITTVDSYQGEENDVIILSLVRSNPQGSVGFLNVCILTLFRGLYCTDRILTRPCRSKTVFVLLYLAQGLGYTSLGMHK